MARRRLPSSLSTDPLPRHSGARGPGLASGPHRAKRARAEAPLDVPIVPEKHDGGSIQAVERRAFLRVDVDLEISLGPEETHFTAQGVNLSPGGVLVSTFRVLEPGSLLPVEFDLPVSHVVAEGVVLWSREATDESRPRYGIAFTELTRFDRTLIEAFCAAHAPEAYASFLDRRLAG